MSIRGYQIKDGKKQDVIFVHIPKTGGSSITQALIASGLKPIPILKKYSLQDFVRKLKGIPRSSRHPYAINLKKIIGSNKWENSFSFAFVRNPWDLMVSNYNFWLQLAPRYEQLKQDAQKIKIMSGFSEFMQSKYGSQQIVQHHGNMRDWLCDENGKIVGKFVGKFEQIQEHWLYVCEQVGLKPTELQYSKKTVRKNYRDYYDEKTIKIVEKRFEWVINEFGYQF